MTVKQEEIRIKLPSVMLKKMDELINGGWFDNRNDIVAYAIRRYTDEIERIDAINYECEKLKKKLKE
jgi:hypothetical protein